MIEDLIATGAKDCSYPTFATGFRRRDRAGSKGAKKHSGAPVADATLGGPTLSVTSPSP